MPFLEINEITKRQGNFKLSVNLTAEKGELIALIGPSGAGKSTLLSIISGSEEADSGSLVINGRNITKEKMQNRNIGMIFQDFSLFPTMNTERNICYGMKGMTKSEKKEKSEELLELVGLPGYGERSVSTLSGGEAQRIALARSLAAKPDILLLDEPLSALDPPMRKKLRSAISEISKALNMTMLYVTHDIEEALAVSDRIAIMIDGTIVAVGTGEKLYSDPPSEKIAFFMGEGTILPSSLFFPGTEGKVFFRPESAVINEEASFGMINRIVMKNATVKSSEYSGGFYSVNLDYRGYGILATSLHGVNSEHVTVTVPRDDLSFFR